MAESTTLARPYARAAFSVAKADGRLEPWAEALTAAAGVSQNEKMQALFGSPALTAAQKSATLEKLLGDLADEKVSNFLKVLADNNRLPLLPEIRSLFIALKAHQEKSVEVHIRSAFPASDEVQAKLTDALAQKLERKVTLAIEVDKTLLGGAVIRAGDTVIDGSVRGRLAKLADTIVS